ncbi:MAG TPA: M1 family metallopeptidase [Caulobacteraceae bacterium]|nr:M1 family metallopeptidase [Caulobacteraceae bacterium]
MRTPLLATLLALWLSGIAGPGAAAPAYSPAQTFAPLPAETAVNRYRSGDGAPGPDYWQNRADYQIAATLEPKTKTLTGRETITYTNNSPAALGVLWLQLDQNIYRKGSRAGAVGGFPRTKFTDGDVLDAVEVESGGKFVAAKYIVTDTRMEIVLPAELKAGGGKIRLRIAWHYTVPGTFGGRTAWVDTPHGEVYDIAQWYPRMAVYDDVRGWDPLPYLGQEFYLEYGDFDYQLTVPADMIVAGSGELMNPKEVLTPEQLARLAQARTSDKTVLIRTPEEVAAAQPSDQVKTWRFHMDHTRDVAFGASRAYVWDAARATLPDGKTVLIQSVYPPESGGEPAWGRSTEYLKFAVEEFSRRWYPYPWPNAINVAGPVGGMEYPAVLFDSDKDTGERLFFLTVHEIGHTYFPMVVGTDERRWAWMDEGLNTFIDTYESDAFEGGVYGPKRDQEYAPGAGTPADQIAALIADPKAPPIMTRADAIPFAYGHKVDYFKTAFGLRLLRDDIIGPDRFDIAFRKFIRDWAYKHPQPSDFFRSMDSGTGEDLSYFWRGYFFHNWALDLTVDGVSYVDGDPAKGAKIALTSRGRLILPVTVKVAFKDGSTREVKLPAEAWIQSASHVIDLDSTQPIASVVVDPDHIVPESDRAAGTWTAP